MTIRLALTGDVMTGRGIDQAFATPAALELYEPFVTDTRGYIALAERDRTIG
jgi:poly-gamma-glutamate synthesis protein (capsule biosynthesis protein)